MAAKNVVNKYVQCNTLLEKQLEHGNIKLINKRSKLNQCNLQPTRRNVSSSTADLQECQAQKSFNRRTVGCNTGVDEDVSATCLDRIVYALRTVDEFRLLQYEVRCCYFCICFA